MPQTHSAEKYIRQSKKRHALNLQYKRKMKDLIKELRTLVAKGKKAEAEKLLPQVYKAIDKAAKKNVIKKGNAWRKKSRLTLAIGKIGKTVVTETKKTPKAKKESSKPAKKTTK